MHWQRLDHSSLAQDILIVVRDGPGESQLSWKAADRFGAERLALVQELSRSRIVNVTVTCTQAAVETQCVCSPDRGRAARRATRAHYEEEPED
eukprot:3319645-Rhodomonas_salina.2